MLRADVIRTGRLTLLPLRAEHAGALAPVLFDPRLYTFTGGEPETVADVVARQTRLAAGSPDPAVFWGNWVIAVDGAVDRAVDGADGLAGTVQTTVTAADDGSRTAEVAWVVGSAWQGRGIASEAAAGLVEWLRGQSVRRIVAHIHPDHHASAAVAASAGLAATDEWVDGERRWELAVG